MREPTYTPKLPLAHANREIFDAAGHPIAVSMCAGTLALDTLVRAVNTQGALVSIVRKLAGMSYGSDYDERANLIDEARKWLALDAKGR